MLTILLLLAEPTELPECDHAAADAGIQQSMNICAAREFAEADAALNAQWAITKAVMNQRDEQWEEDNGTAWDSRDGHFETLLMAQHAWLTYRDKHCRSVGLTARGGSLEPLLVTTCKKAVTYARTQQLRDLAQTY